MSDIIRVLRVIEYVGERKVVEKQVAESLTGTKVLPGMIIKVATVGAFPEILDTKKEIK